MVPSAPPIDERLPKRGGPRPNSGRKKKSVTDAIPVDESYYEARRRKEMAVAKLRELELEAARGDFVKLEDVRSDWAGLIGIFRSRLLALPSRLASEVVAVNNLREAENLLRDAIHDVLTELADEVASGRARN